MERQVKNLFYFTIGIVSIALLFIFIDQANSKLPLSPLIVDTEKGTESFCQEGLQICTESCQRREGIFVYQCYGDNIAVDEKYKCRCVK